MSVLDKNKKYVQPVSLGDKFENVVRWGKQNSYSFEVQYDRCVRNIAVVITRTGENAVSHNRVRPYFRIQHGRGEVRSRRVYLNVHSVTGNVVDTKWSVEF